MSKPAPTRKRRTRHLPFGWYIGINRSFSPSTQPRIRVRWLHQTKLYTMREVRRMAITMLVACEVADDPSLKRKRGK